MHLGFGEEGVDILGQARARILAEEGERAHREVRVVRIVEARRVAVDRARVRGRIAEAVDRIGREVGLAVLRTEGIAQRPPEQTGLAGEDRVEDVLFFGRFGPAGPGDVVDDFQRVLVPGNIGRVRQAQRRIARRGIDERVEVEATIGPRGSARAVLPTEAVQCALQTIADDIVGEGRARTVDVRARGLQRQGVRQLDVEAARNAPRIVDRLPLAGAARVERIAAQCEGPEQHDGREHRGKQARRRSRREGLLKVSGVAGVAGRHGEGARATRAIGALGDRIAGRIAQFEQLRMGIERLRHEADLVRKIGGELAIDLVAIFLFDQVHEGDVAVAADRQR